MAKSIYDEDQPIGMYGRLKMYRSLDEVLARYYGNDINTKQIIDLGCGNGGMLEYFIKRGFTGENALGIDLSEVRIKKAKTKFPDINFQEGNIIEFNLEGKQVDLITAFDVFSHLNFDEQINKAIQNIRNHLQVGGMFLWYDIFSKDHFGAPNNADAWGYSKQQMVNYVEKNGFEVIEYNTLFKLFFNRYPSVYQAVRIPFFLLSLLEKIIPGNPGNHFVLAIRK